MNTPSCDGVRTQVRAFQAGEKHAPHRDQHSRVSVILRGEIAEESAWGETRLTQGDVLFKSHQVVHEDRFGPRGASIFSVLFEGGETCAFSAARLDGAWLAIRAHAARDVALAAMEAAAAGDSGGLKVAAADLLACAPAPDRCGSVPAWLQELYRMLQDVSLAEIDIGAHAKAGGRHPVTVSRAFRQRFGVSITEHASKQSVRRAIAALARGETDLAAIAVEAGFYDQSHMNRVFLRVTRRTPGAHRAMLAAAS